MTQYNKLVRDKIPEILNELGKEYEQRVADDTEYRIELIKKLQEETQEFLVAYEPEELADVLEVVMNLMKLPDYQNVEKLRIAKLEEKGGFDKRLILKGEK